MHSLLPLLLTIHLISVGAALIAFVFGRPRWFTTMLLAGALLLIAGLLTSQSMAGFIVPRLGGDPLLSIVLYLSGGLLLFSATTLRLKSIMSGRLA